MAERHAITGKKLFWIASILVVLLLAIQILASTQVTQYNANDLGLLSRLPITFWVGLSYLCVLLYFGRKSGLRTIIVAVLISFYLFGIPTLMSENKAEFLGISYWFSSQGIQLLSAGHLSFGNLYPLNLLNWPGFFILAGFISASTGLKVTLFADYFPLLTMALLGVLAYKTLRLQLNTLLSSFGALWFIASFWTGQNYFSPQGIAYVIYFAIFLLLAKLFFTKKQNVKFPLTVFIFILILILFIGLVSTHLLTSFALAIGVIAVYALCKVFPQKRKIATFYSITTCILLVSVFFAYQALVITQSFSGIAELLYSQFSRGDTHLAVISQGRAVQSPALLLSIFGSYSITIIAVVIAVIAILTTALGILLYKKEEAKNDLFWIAWIIVAGIIGVCVFYGGEAIERAFILMLLPICYFAAKFFSKKPRILVFVLIIIVFLQIPALYGSENYSYVPTSELKGVAFYTIYAPSTAPFFYEADLASFGSRVTGIQLGVFTGASSLPSSELVNEKIGKANFIISSNEQRNFYQYFYGANLLENLSLDDYYNRVYDNGGFQIYARLSQ
jgi:hypothetical protein